MADGVDAAFLGAGWAFPVRRDVDGEVDLTAHEENIHQAVHLILGTARGERVMRPDFGAGLQALVFEPLNTTTIALARHHVEEALATWEPRIALLAVRVKPDPGAAGTLLIEIDYRVRATNTFSNLVYPFYLLEGRQT